MREFLRNCGLNPEQINMVEVFILLYGYKSLEELLEKTTEELAEHNGWDDDVAHCINLIREHQS